MKEPRLYEKIDSPNNPTDIYLNRQIEIVNERALFYSKLFTENDLVFDIGANMGNRVLPFLMVGAKVIAVEPQEHCVMHLQECYGDEITIVNKAIGPEQSHKELYIADIHTMSSFAIDWISAVKATGRFSNLDWTKKEIIHMITLDQLINDYGIPKFIKIDVEGYELEVLMGLSHRIDCISFEYTVPEQTDKCIYCIRRLTEINKNCLFNYCIGEDMRFTLAEWLPAELVIEKIEKEFIKPEFGDIYVKMI